MFSLSVQLFTCWIVSHDGPSHPDLWLRGGVSALMRLVKVTVPSALLFSAAASIWCSEEDCYSDRNASSSRARLWK